MKKTLYVFVLPLLAATILTGCEPQGFEGSNGGKVTAIAIEEAVYNSSGTPSMQLSFKDNTELQLTVAIMPRNAANQKVTFTNRHPELLEVTETGLLRPKGVGTDTLTVSATDGSGVSTTFVVNIIDHMVKATAINVTAAGTEFDVKLGNTFDLGVCVTLAPADTWNKTVTYTSGDTSVATVDASGIVTGVSEGNTTVIIRTTDGSDLSKECKVTVKGDVIRYVDLARAGWSATTSHPYVTDASVDGSPASLIDENTGSCLSLYRPGKGTVPETDVVYFILDMGSPQEFNYFRIIHRQNNTIARLRVWGVSFYGSNDGTNFTEIKTGIELPNAKTDGPDNAKTGDIEIPKSTYRYLKMTYDDYEYPSASGTLQIAEFYLGNIVIE